MNFIKKEPFDLQTYSFRYRRGVIRLVNRFTGKTAALYMLIEDPLGLSVEEGCLIFGDLELPEKNSSHKIFCANRISIRIVKSKDDTAHLRIQEKMDYGYNVMAYELNRLPLSLIQIDDQLIVTWPDV